MPLVKTCANTEAQCHHEAGHGPIRKTGRWACPFCSRRVNESGVESSDAQSSGVPVARPYVDSHLPVPESKYAPFRGVREGEVESGVGSL